MRTSNNYICDRCGDKLEGEPISLSTFYQRGVHYDRRNPHGVKHMCVFCKRLFDMNFKSFFNFFNTINNEQSKKTHNTTT